MLHTLANEKMPQFVCDKCNFICSKQSNYDKHTSTRKHIISTNAICMPIEKMPQFSCERCNISCSSKRDYDRHLSTQKHKNMQNTTHNDDNTYNCKCGSTYKYSSSYYRHKKNCTYIPPIETPVTKEKTELEHNQTNEPDNKWFEIIQMLIKENQETRNLVLTQHNTLIELVKNQQPTTNNSHNNNTNYNINMFLSEKCKDAKNITEFIETLKNKVDMFQIEETGYVDGISKLFIDELKSMQITERPLHCTDERRNTFYVHNNNAWNKDQNLNDTKKAINSVSHTNLQQCLAWSANEPAKEVDREEHINRSIQLCKEANSSCEDANVDKIIKNISKEIPLNKQVISEL
jgi:hypothetical protein